MEGEGGLTSNEIELLTDSMLADPVEVVITEEASNLDANMSVWHGLRNTSINSGLSEREK